MSRFNNPIPPTFPRSAKSQLRLVRRQGGMRKRRPLRHNVGRGSLRRFNLSHFRSVAPKSESLPFLRGNPLMSRREKKSPPPGPAKTPPPAVPAEKPHPAQTRSLPGPALVVVSGLAASNHFLASHGSVTCAGPVRSVAPATEPLPLRWSRSNPAQLVRLSRPWEIYSGPAPAFKSRSASPRPAVLAVDSLPEGENPSRRSGGFALPRGRSAASALRAAAAPVGSLSPGAAPPRRPYAPPPLRSVAPGTVPPSAPGGSPHPGLRGAVRGPARGGCR
jgi:hypothetical protein